MRPFAVCRRLVAVVVLGLVWGHGVSVVAGLDLPPLFTVDLSRAPADRWEGVVELALSRHAWDDSFGPAFSTHNASLFDNLLPPHWELMAAAVDTHYPDHAAELRSLSAQFSAAGHAVSYEYLCGWVWFHELAHTDLVSADSAEDLGRECTAVLAADRTGRVLHGGNMDQMPASVRNLTLQFDFLSPSPSSSSAAATASTPGADGDDDDVLFRGVDWYWFTTGTTRAVRAGVASLQENWRTTTVRPHQLLFHDIQRGVLPQVWVFRHALQQTNPTLDWPRLLSYLITTPLGAPFYIAAAGPKAWQGAIITRNLTAATSVDYLASSSATSDTSTTISPRISTIYDNGSNRTRTPSPTDHIPSTSTSNRTSTNTSTSTSNSTSTRTSTRTSTSARSPTTGEEAQEDGRWFLVQTNYDRSLPDSPSDPRRTAAETLVHRLGQPHLSRDIGMVEVLSTYPVHNPHSAYTAVMRPDTGELWAYVLDAMCPEVLSDAIVIDSRYCLAAVQRA